MGDYDDNENDDDYYSEEDKEFDLERMRKETEEFKRNGERALRAQERHQRQKGDGSSPHARLRQVRHRHRARRHLREEGDRSGQNKGMGIAGKATLALFTGGLSLVAQKAMGRSPTTPLSHPFAASLCSWTARATTGSFGGGSMTFGGQSNFSCRHERQLRLRQQKYVDTLALKIDFNDLDMPTTVITYISERTKTSSREYRKAEGELMNAVGALRSFSIRSEPPGSDRQIFCYGKRPLTRQDQWSAKQSIRIARVGYARQEDFFNYDTFVMGDEDQNRQEQVAHQVVRVERP
ncbi:MAG: hypothetical protein ACLS89_02200 [Collinsella sp.]